MNKGEKYFTYYKSPAGFRQALEATYTGSIVDMKRIKNGLVYDSLQKAKTALALIK